MNSKTTRKITITDTISGITELTFKCENQPIEPELTSSYELIVKYMLEHNWKLVDLKCNDNKEVVQDDEDNMCISKNDLRQLFEENKQLMAMRDSCILQLKQSKTPLFDRLCDTNINTNTLFYMCNTCNFKGKNPKALAAHMKNKDCTNKRNSANEIINTEQDHQSNTLSI